MQKLKLNSEEVLKEIINYMLREYDADYDFILKHPKINNTLWFNYYWDTQESKNDFLKWLKKYLKQKVDYSPFKIDDVVNSINSTYGLKVYDKK